MYTSFCRSRHLFLSVVQEEWRRTRNCAAESLSSPTSRRRRAERYFEERWRRPESVGNCDDFVSNTIDTMFDIKCYFEIIYKRRHRLQSISDRSKRQLFKISYNIWFYCWLCADNLLSFKTFLETWFIVSFSVDCIIMLQCTRYTLEYINFWGIWTYYGVLLLSSFFQQR